MKLLVVCLLYLCYCVSAREIIISEKGSDTPSCLEEHDPLVSCQSLVKVSEYVTSNKLNNVTIRINDTNYTLQGVANFSGVENITITGKGRSLTHINCNSADISGAGIAFENSLCITIKKFTISNCGATIVNTNRSHLTGNGTAIQIINCSQVSVSDIVVYRSISQGLTFINTGSTVQVIDSHFIDNTVFRSQWLGGGALQIVFHGTVDLNTSTDYVIANSVFMYNKATTRSVKEHKIFNSKYCERGGGIRIILFDNVCSNSSITLDKNTFEGNTAVFGGGTLICVSGNTSHSSIQISNSNFTGNKVLAGGGGLDMGYTTYVKSSVYPTRNVVSISQSYFINNSASFGGGVSMFAASIRFIDEHAHNDIVFTECYFDTNSASGGAAVNIGQDIFKNNGEQHIVLIVFINCTIENNMVIFGNSSSVFKNLQQANGASDGNGAFFVSDVYVKFKGTTQFKGNNGTALYLDSTTAMFSTGIAHFINNSGYEGGAILLFGNSVIYFGDIASFHFYNNTAIKMGGAICALTGGKHVFSYMNSCFLNIWHDNNVTNRSFHFLNNTATIGDDIYATSIASCNMLCSHRMNNSNVDDTSLFFDHDCYGNFNFSNLEVKKSVATSPVSITIEFKDPITPGIVVHLKMTQVDEIGGNVSQLLFLLTAKVQKSLHNARVDPAYTVIPNNSIVILGMPGDEGEILFESSTIRHVVNFKLSYCGPGFVFREERMACDCAGSSNYSKIHCEANKFASIPINYWAGYKNYDNATQDTFYTGVCVTQLCNHQPGMPDCDDNRLLCKLPPSANASKLEEQICGKNRHGRLCGRCVSQNSVYYHSDDFKCGGNAGCSYGIPIYIASELLPVTIIFLIILLFNISLTSGAVYSFVFYIQILSSITITAFGKIQIKDNNTQGAVEFIQIFLEIFSFDIRGGKFLDFCIFQTDTIMNLFMIKYATLAYAFFLVIATILIMRVHSCYSCVKLCRRCGRRNIRGSIVDGLSAFLVLCYFQCAVVTSHILTPSHLYGINGTIYTTVALFDGELDYLKGAHLRYAVPAFLCMIFILIPPPTILILEPILTKLFSMDCFTRTPPKWYYYKLRLKLMPFLDSFQACFKDRHRYFAGLYFLYRLLFPITGMIVQGPQHYHSFAICLFMFITIFHVLLRPYKEKWHNLLEIFLFMNVIFLLIVTVYNLAFDKSDGTHLIIAQLILIFLSIGYMVVYITIKVYQKLSSLKTKKETSVSRECTDVNDSLPYRLLNDTNEVTISNSYRTF